MIYKHDGTIPVPEAARAGVANQWHNGAVNVDITIMIRILSSEWGAVQTTPGGKTLNHTIISCSSAINT
jgi:hypothetical protein